MRIETSILTGLVFDDEYSRKVVPFLKTEYFTDKIENAIVDESVKFFNKYNKRASKEVLSIELAKRSDFSDEEHSKAQEYVESFELDQETSKEWLIEETEKFCKDRAIYNAILDSITIIDGKDKHRDNGAIPSLLSDALAVSFDNHIGHDYLEDFALRYEFYHRKESKISFDIDILNKITNGGLSNKTLNVFLAGTGVGKSLTMCHFAASFLEQGHDVLYITMEMSEERIAERIDANLLKIPIQDIKSIDSNTFNTRINKIKAKTNGKLIIKEFPTGSAHAGHFRALIEELKLKKKFKPRVIFIDYLNICASSRVRHGANVNTYSYIKSIAEELRGLAVEYDVPVISATQTNREGLDASDISLTNTSESIGLPQTVDLFLAMISSDELAELGQIMFKQLKNRYADLNYYKRFVVGIDKRMMTLYNVEASAQEDIVDRGTQGQKVAYKPEDDKPLFDRSTSSNDFGGWKF